jgi:FKBP-type peptidyl-prolyl cis-trans isomerase FklB
MSIKHQIKLLISFGLLMTFIHSEAQKTAKPMDSLSYSVGILVASNLKSQGIVDIKAEDMAIGVSDIINERETKISLEEANAFLENYMKKQTERAKEENTKVGMAFLAENAKKTGVVTLPSGLQYEILKVGNGPKPGLTDKVKTHYHGTLIDGTVFDSSVNRGEPASFPVNGVIKGWIEALQLMPVGSKWKLYVPYDLAYGDRGAGAMIKPYSTLIFEVELLEIVK